MAKKIAHIRKGDLATYRTRSGELVPVKVTQVIDGNTAQVNVTADREGYDKGTLIVVTSNLTSQALVSRKSADLTLLVW